MTAGQMVALLLTWVVASIPLSLLAGHFIGFGSQIESAGESTPRAAGSRKAA